MRLSHSPVSISRIIARVSECVSREGIIHQIVGRPVATFVEHFNARVASRRVAHVTARVIAVN